MLHRRIVSLAMSVLLTFLLVGCSSIEGSKETDSQANDNIKPIDNSKKIENLTEDRSVYNDDKPDSIAQLYITVPKDNNILNGKVTTMKELNSYRYDFTVGETDNKPKVEVLFQEGSPNGPAKGYFGYETSIPNASLEPRGHAGANEVQKSFKIRLYDKAGLWNYNRVINLNKHAQDLTRVRNKLSFDFFKLIPNMASFRTQFVHLYIKDLSNDTSDHGFIDYGLFTQIEQPNKAFLKSHGLDPLAHLYKAQLFEFQRYPDNLKLADDPKYNKKEFEKIITIEGNEDHTKLLKMLDDVNDYNKDINSVVDKHFNRENMLTWAASNVLMGNIDIENENYFLYSPLNSNTWYFIPWDYDTSWGLYDQVGSKEIKPSEYRSGISNYWGSVLFRRFFKDPQNVKMLNQKIDDLIKIINKEKTTELLKKYHDIAFKYVNAYPDLKNLPSRVENFETEYWRISSEGEKNKDKYYKSLEKPMPIYLGEVVFELNKMKFTWDKSFDLQEDDLTYNFEIATDPNFSNVVVQKKGLKDTEITLDKLMAGIYYWRVIVYDAKGNRQVAFDDYRDSQGNIYYGIKQFIVKSQ